MLTGRQMISLNSWIHRWYKKTLFHQHASFPPKEKSHYDEYTSSIAKYKSHCNTFNNQ